MLITLMSSSIFLGNGHIQCPYILTAVGFTYAGTMTYNVLAGKIIDVWDIHCQDHAHIVKRFINHLDYASRCMEMGRDNFVHMYLVKLVVNIMGLITCGLRLGDLARNRDKMNYAAACRIAMRKLRRAVQLVHDGMPGVPTVNLAGLILYLKVVWSYLEIFEGAYSDVGDKVELAAYVVTVLRIWRLWAYTTHLDTV